VRLKDHILTQRHRALPPQFIGLAPRPNTLDGKLFVGSLSR
jgi:hypothetical protein